MENKATELNASIRRTIEQLANETDAARQSELFRDYLRTSAALWDYSWHNQMLIWQQRQDASFVGGFNTWLKRACTTRRSTSAYRLPDRPSASKKSTTASGWSVLWITISAILIWRKKPCSPCRTPSGQKCNPCLRNVLLPMSRNGHKYICGSGEYPGPLVFSGKTSCATRLLRRALG